MLARAVGRFGRHVFQSQHGEYFYHSRMKPANIFLPNGNGHGGASTDPWALLEPLAYLLPPLIELEEPASQAAGKKKGGGGGGSSKKQSPLTLSLLMSVAELANACVRQGMPRDSTIRSPRRPRSKLQIGYR